MKPISYIYPLIKTTPLTKPFISSSHILLLNQISTLPKWNTSTKTLPITNPTLILMEQCSSMSQLKQIHAHMTRKGLIFHTFPISRIIAFSALSNNGDINYAHLVFDQIECPNVYIWNTMIKGFCINGNALMGLCFFRRMLRFGVEMDERSFVFVLKCFGRGSGLGDGGVVHCLIWKMGFGFSVLVRNGLVSFYGGCGFLRYARKVFDESPVRDVVTWTAMIDGYVKNKDVDEGLRVFDSMCCCGVVPNEVTMVSLLSASGIKGDLKLGRRMRDYMGRIGVECTLNVMNALLDMFVKCGCLATAREIFDKMECRDVFSWTSMVNGYAKYGELELARKCFDEMPMKNVVSWNAMIAGYSQNNRPKEALDLFQDMVNGGMVPNEATLVCVLSACAQSGCFDFGHWIYRHYVHEKRIELGVPLGNAMIDMYSKCGRIDMAEEIFEKMRKRDLVSWNSMIVGYADHGNANKALILFDRMKDKEIKPDDVTFVGILSACSHAGLVSIGHKLFTSMEQVFGLNPKLEHYVCLIDLLGRVGLVQEAYHMIRTMPMEPDIATWGALLNACRMHRNADLGKLAAEKLINLDPEDSGTYAILASICAKGRRWEDVKAIRTMMREKGVRKTPGCSSIEIEGRFHEFSASDDSHPCAKDIYKTLDEIYVVSKLEQNLVCISQSIHCFENEDLLCYGV